MKEYKVKLSHLRISPRKTRLVADLIRGESAVSARNQLAFSTKKAATPILKLLESAISNAKNINDNASEEDLVVKEIRVDEGPMLKRYQPVSRGAVHEIQKKTSHVTLILTERGSKAEKKENTHEQETKEKEKTKK